MKSNWVSESDFNKDGQTEIHKLIWDIDINHMHCKRKYTPRQRGTLSSITYDWVLIECEFCNQNGSINVIAFRLTALCVEISSLFMYTIFFHALIFTIALLSFLVLLCYCVRLLSRHCTVCSTPWLATSYNSNLKCKPIPIHGKCNTASQFMKTIHHASIRWFEQIDRYYR